MLRNLLNEYVTAYVNDVLIYTDGSLSKYREQVREVLRRLRDDGLRLDIDKYEFEVRYVKYLSMIVDVENGISINPKKVAVIWE